MDETLTKVLYEKLLIQYMFNDEIVREKMIPFLNPAVFMNGDNVQVVKNIQSFMERHNHFPRISELKLFIDNGSTYDHLIDVMNVDSSEYDRDFILGELEEFYRKSLISNFVIDIAESMKTNDSNALSIYSDKLRECASFSFNNDIGVSLLDDIDKIYSGLHDKDRVFSTGIKLLDYYLGGGFHEKSLNLFMGSVNKGKSLILYAMAVAFLLSNKKTFILSLEMSEEKVFERILANLFDVDIALLRGLSKEKFYEYYEIIKKKLKNNLYVLQRPAKTVSANVLRSILKDYKTKKGVTFEVIVIDYISLMCQNRVTSKNDNLYSEMKTIAEEVRGVMVEEELCGVSAVQTNRSGFDNLDLEMTSISESIGLAATADSMIGIMQSDELRAAGKYKWSILKNRYGINNVSFYVGVDYPKMRIYNLESDLEEHNVAKPKNMVDEASVQVLSTMKSNVRSKRSDYMGIE